MTRRLHSGLYEDLMTSALEAEINARRAEGWWVDVSSADSTVRPELLARHVYHLLRRALEGIPEADDAQPANQVALANRLVEVLVEYGAMADDRVADAARLLLEAVERRGRGGVGAGPVEGGSGGSAATMTTGIRTVSRGNGRFGHACRHL